ncbi:MAG: Re/Si-specific NAD(P)(+) transhydrogenase subunit alpha [Maricaulaceae bacterium]
MKIAVLTERRDGESRVAATPDTVKKFVAAGHTVAVETGAGANAFYADALYQDAGARIAADMTDALSGAELVLKVRRPTDEELAATPRGASVVGLVAPFAEPDLVARYAEAGVDVFSMEFTPRITRAQSMDALSSQANLAGYRAIIEAAQTYGRVMPMMMTAAGTVAPAKVFVMGAGVAGLQAIATARRMGAVVSATDVRPAAKEQVQSLAAKFIAVEDEEFKAAETAGGYAKEMSDAYKAKQAELIASHIAKQDIVVTTALIPGRPAPTLVTQAMVESMKPGSVVVDLAAEAGGNCELTQPGVIALQNGVKLYGYVILPGMLAADASALYAKNLLALSPLLTGEDGGLAPHWDDEIITAMALTRDGAIVHDAFKPKEG